MSIIREQNKLKSREGIKKIAETYRNDKGVIDLSKLRNEQPNIYSKIPYHFQNLGNFILQMNNKGKDIEDNLGVGISSITDALRNKLSYDRLAELYSRDKENMTWEEIGLMYGKSKAYMNRLYNDFDKVTDSGTSLNRDVVRNRLAFDQIKDLKMNKSWEEIAVLYKTTEPQIQSVFSDLEKVFGKLN